MPLIRSTPTKPKTTAEKCREAGGLLEVNLGNLRTELGYAKLGRWVLEEIKGDLEKQKLGFFPADRLDPAANTEPRQWQTVWVYDRKDSTSSLARVIDAVLNPDKNDVAAALKGLLEGQTEQLTAAQKIARMRELLATPERQPKKTTLIGE